MCTRRSRTRVAMSVPTKRLLRVLAIDPGYDRLGIAVVEGNSSRPSLVWSDCVTPEAGRHEERLAHISRAMVAALNEYAPDMVAVETLFFGINKKTAIGVAEARGTILAAAGNASLPVLECSPRQIKLAVTGYGNSQKKEIACMVPKLLALPKKKRLDDELDAIALGITALAIGLPRH
jgi:crossover junction endodeoxyribonuclease RuvC